jgi:proteic killer suppression protein
MNKSSVIWAKDVTKQLCLLPSYIREKFYAWAIAIEKVGIHEVRKSPGFHDEPLKGKRIGQRSIRLNKSYRAIYVTRIDGSIEIVEVVEINKHEY